MTIEELKTERASVDVATLPIDGDLHDWIEGPENGAGHYVIYGRIHNDRKNRFPDGKSIRTSAIVKVEDGVAVTLNSAYRLVEGATSA